VSNNSFLYRLLIDTDRFLSQWSKAYLLLRDAVIHFSVQKDKVKAETLPDELAGKVKAETGPVKNMPAPNEPLPQAANPEEQAAAAAFLDEVNRMGEAIVFAMNDESSAHGARFALVTRIGLLAVAAFNRNIPALYLFEPLQNPRLMLAGDPTRHPNEAASGVIAWEISKFLKDNGLVPEAHIPNPNAVR
jgi:hypothetical protein